MNEKLLKTNCTNCGNEIYRRPWYVKNTKCFCNVGCGRQFKYKSEHPKTLNIINHENPNFYYLLGLIATDGHLQWPGCTKSGKTYQVSIELNEKDLLILKKIQYEFGGVIVNTAKHCKKWIVHSKDFVCYLRDTVNMSHNKSLNLDVAVWFNGLVTDNKLHFLRGVIDGDGSIFLNEMRNGDKQLRLRIYSGSRAFIDMLYVFLCGGFINPRNTHCYAYCANGAIASNILDTLYAKKTDLFFERKYNIYCNYSQQ